MSNFKRILETAKDFISECSATSSRGRKEEILNRYIQSDNFRKLIERVYNPFEQFYLSSANYCKRPNVGDTNMETDDLFELLLWLSSRNVTGYSAIAAVRHFVKQINDPELLMTFFKILDKDLKCGVDVKTINAVCPDLIPEFHVALGEDAPPTLNLKMADWYASRKFDGVRCLAQKTDVGGIAFYSRSGKLFETLDQLRRPLEDHSWKNFVLDGELCIVKDGMEDFQGAMKEIRKKNHTIKHPVFYVFDILKLSEFEKGASDRKFSERQNDLSRFMIQLSGRNIRMVDQELIRDKATLKKRSEEAVTNGWEGLILRKDTIYKGRRSSDILKVKQFLDAEYVVTGVTTGPFSTIEGGKVKPIECVTALEISHKGNKVGVGSGLSIDQRKAWFKDPKLIIGKTITVKYFEETTDQKGKPSLRFPTLKILHGEKRET